MGSTSEEHTIIGTFADPSTGDRAADAARTAGFPVERRSDGAVIVHPGPHRQHADEVEGILRAYGAREYGGLATQVATSETDRASDRTTEPGRGGNAGQQRVRAQAGTTVELVEEQLRARTRPVQTGELTIRKEVVAETRTIEVPVQRQELVIERRQVQRQPLDSAERRPSDPLVEQLMERLRHMRSGETLRIPIIEEEIVVHKRPVVVEEITVGKRMLEETQQVSDTVRREEARIEPHGDVRLHED
jgi:stress response protein YsnF